MNRIFSDLYTVWRKIAESLLEGDQGRCHRWPQNVVARVAMFAGEIAYV